MENIDNMIERWFEATLTQEEETALKVFLASEEGQAPEYDEIRAVMGYFATGRAVSGTRKPVRLWGRLMAVAASLALVVTLGIKLYNNNNVCVSFVDGRKITDKEVVMNDVDSILADLLTDRMDMEDQLTDFFTSGQNE